MSKESFEPLNANHGNVDGRISYFRDRFLSAEMDYFKALMQDESNREIFASYLDYPPDMLFKEAMGRIKLIEYGMVKKEELSMIQAEITLMLAAIQDKAKINDLIITMDHEQSNGRVH